MTDTQEILIVEDERITSLEIKMQIRKMGLGVFGYAPSGEKALELCRHEAPDLILMDIMLEGELDGIDTTRQLKDRYDVPVIYISAFADDTTKNRANETAPHAILSKPFSPHELKRNIFAALGKEVQ